MYVIIYSKSQIKRHQESNMYNWIRRHEGFCESEKFKTIFLHCFLLKSWFVFKNVRSDSTNELDD